MAWTDAARAASAAVRRAHAKPKYTAAQKRSIGYRFHGIPSTPKVSPLISRSKWVREQRMFNRAMREIKRLRKQGK